MTRRIRCNRDAEKEKKTFQVAWVCGMRHHHIPAACVRCAVRAVWAIVRSDSIRDVCSMPQGHNRRHSFVAFIRFIAENIQLRPTHTHTQVSTVYVYKRATVRALIFSWLQQQSHTVSNRWLWSGAFIKNWSLNVIGLHNILLSRFHATMCMRPLYVRVCTLWTVQLLCGVSSELVEKNVHCAKWPEFNVLSHASSLLGLWRLATTRERKKSFRKIEHISWAELDWYVTISFCIRRISEKMKHKTMKIDFRVQHLHTGGCETESKLKVTYMQRFLHRYTHSLHTTISIISLTLAHTVCSICMCVCARVCECESHLPWSFAAFLVHVFIEKVLVSDLHILAARTTIGRKWRTNTLARVSVCVGCVFAQTIPCERARVYVCECGVELNWVRMVGGFSCASYIVCLLLPSDWCRVCVCVCIDVVRS